MCGMIEYVIFFLRILHKNDMLYEMEPGQLKVRSCNFALFSINSLCCRLGITKCVGCSTGGCDLSPQKPDRRGGLDALPGRTPE